MRVLVEALVVLALMTSQCRADSWWMNQPFDSSSDFNELVEYTENATLACADSRMNPDLVYEEQYWIRPDLTVMYPGNTTTFKTLDGTAGWEVTDDWEMKVFVVQEEHFGFYHCITLDNNDTVHVVKKGVNYKGAYFGDLWDVYRMNVIIGCSAAAGFVVGCIVIYAIHLAFFNDEHGDDVSADMFNSGGYGGTTAEGIGDIIVADNDYDYATKSDAHLRSSFGKAAGLKNNAYTLDEDFTKL